MTQEDLTALNTFIGKFKEKYPGMSWEIEGSYKGVRFEFFTDLRHSFISEYHPTLSEAIAEVVVYMEAAGVV